MNYQIISDYGKLLHFIEFLPKLEANETYYLSLFARHKYCASVPNLKDNQLVRFYSNKENMLEKITRLACPLGGYMREGQAVPQEALALYIAINPRNLVKANKALLVELAERCSEGNVNFNPVSLINTVIHRATDRKVFVDFDYDKVNYNDYLPTIRSVLPDDAYRVLKTRGGFHLLVVLEKVKEVKEPWFKTLSNLAGCDVKGSNTMVPVPGCFQGGFVPHFIQD